MATNNSTSAYLCMCMITSLSNLFMYITRIELYYQKYSHSNCNSILYSCIIKNENHIVKLFLFLSFYFIKKN